MWIKSQDGKSIVRADNLHILEDKDGSPYICTVQNGDFIMLGEYSGNECQALLNAIERHIDRNQRTFRMPKE